MPQPEPQTTVGRPGYAASFVYALSIGVAIVAVLLRYALDPVMGDTLPLVTLFGAVAAAVWVGGYRPAIVVALLGYAACAYLFIAPRGQLGLDGGNIGNVVGLVAYLFTCALIIGFGEAVRAAQLRAGAQREVFRITLASIGDAVITTDTKVRRDLHESRRRVVDGLDSGRRQGAAARRGVSHRQRGYAPPVENPATKALREGVVVGARQSHRLDSEGRQRTAD